MRSMPVSWGLLSWDRFQWPPVLGGSSLLAALQTGLARAPLTWASQSPARLQHFRVVKYPQSSASSERAPKVAQLKKEEVGLDEPQPWGMERVLFTTLDLGDFCSEFWPFPLLPEYAISKFLTNCLCSKQVQIAAHMAQLAANRSLGVGSGTTLPGFKSHSKLCNLDQVISPTRDSCFPMKKKRGLMIVLT